MTTQHSAGDNQGSLWPSIKWTVATITVSVGTIVKEVAADQGIEPRDFLLAVVMAVIVYYVPELNPPRSATERTRTG